MTSSSPPWLDLEIDPGDTHSIVESIEMLLLATEESFLSVAELRSRFAAGMQPNDAQIRLAMAEIGRRRQTVGHLYPFSSEDSGVRLHSQGSWYLYAFFLLLSFERTPLRVRKDWKRSDPLFDDVVRRAFEAKLGPGSRSLAFGWPPRDGRPGAFPDAVEWAAMEMGMRLRCTKSRIPSQHRDAGVDVIVWAPFDDSRSGFPVTLVQDTIKFDYVMKPRDVGPERWRDWIECGTTPTVGFAIPFSVRKGHPWWEEVAAEVSIFLDRFRVLGLLRRQDPQLWSSWTEIVEFVESEFSAVGDGIQQGATPQVRSAKSRKAGRPQAGDGESETIKPSTG